MQKKFRIGHKCAKTVSKDMTVYVHQFTVTPSSARFSGVANQYHNFTVTLDSPEGRTTLTDYLTYTWKLDSSASNYLRLDENSLSSKKLTMKKDNTESQKTYNFTCKANVGGRQITIASWTIIVERKPGS